MEASSALDIFKLCWDVLFKESQNFNNAFFNAGHCSLLDSRDSNFDLIENRLAYIYKYGCFNILFVEKCVSKFLSEYHAVENLLHLENLKVCSLSNGPGLDIVGLLYALHKSNKQLRCFPLLKAINFHESWTNLYKLTVQSAYQSINLNWCSEYFDIPSENISLIQCDVFSKLSAEAKNCISDSNLLLMVKVYVSAKATPDRFGNSLREIFSLIKPGTLIFFIGSKTNTKRFSKSKSLKRYVKCIFGPQKVTIENLSYNAKTDKSITDLVGAKPLDSGYAEFMVWQKKAVVDTKEVIQSKKKNRRRKKASKALKDGENAFDGTVTEEYGDESDVESEMSLTSESKYSDASCDDFGSDSNSSALLSPDVPKSIISEKEQDLPQHSPSHSVNRNTSFLDEVNTDEKETSNSQQNKTGSKSDLTNSAHEIEYETKISVDKYIIKSLKNVNSSNESKDSEMSVVHHQLQDGTEKKLNTQDIKFETSILTSGVDSKISSTLNSFEGIKGSGIGKIPRNVNSPLKKGNVLEYNVNCASTSTDSVNKTLHTNLVNPFCQDMNQTDMEDKNLKIKTKNLSLKLKADNVSVKKEFKAASQKVSSMSQSCENLYSRNIITCTESAHSGDHSDIQALLQKCESLVTSLEKLTAEIKSNISSSKEANFVKMCCNTGEACGNFRAYNSHECCVNSVNTCCCRPIQPIHGCEMSQSSCRNCSCSSLPCASNNASRLDIERAINLSSPCITIPLESEDLLHILTSRK